MSDLEVTKLCADAMGFKTRYLGRPVNPEVSNHCMEYYSGQGRWKLYDPLCDGEQAMALEDWLIERGMLRYFQQDEMRFNPFGYEVTQERIFKFIGKEARRRCICECVAKMQAAK